MANILVLGLAASGCAAAGFLLQQGFSVFGFDDKAEVDQSLQTAGLHLYKHQHEIDWKKVSELIVSPGISPLHPIYQTAVALNIPVTGEAALGFRYLNQKVIAITGTNGKTTITLLVEHILRNAGIKARALGNVGTPFTEYLLHPDPTEILVAELSSYQLETMSGPFFDVGILTNITPDHLDRYPSLHAYAGAKQRLAGCIKEAGVFYVYDKAAEEFADLFASCAYKTYGSNPNSEFFTTKEVARHRENIEYFLPLRYRNLGVHESENLLAAWLAVQSFGVTKDEFLAGIESFRKPPHRIEYVASINEVEYYDDSKGTNLDAVTQAILAMQRPVVLIAGGVDKGFRFTAWKEAFAGRVKHVIAIGQTAAAISEDVSGFCPVSKAVSLFSAVQEAKHLAQPGDCVLLSPGCSSFDMFRDYKHRGEEFKRCVAQIKIQEES